MSLSGILLILFLVGHVAGNLTLFADDTGATFDKYAHTLRSNPLLPLIEIGLTALFLFHIGLGLRTALENRQARQSRYKQLDSHGNRTWSSITVWFPSPVPRWCSVSVASWRAARRDDPRAVECGRLAPFCAAETVEVSGLAGRNRRASGACDFGPSGFGRMQ